MTTLAATSLPVHLKSLAGQELVEIFNRQLAKLAALLKLPASSSLNAHWDNLRQVLAGAPTLVLTPNEAELLIAVPPYMVTYVRQMSFLCYGSQPGTVAVRGKFSPADQAFIPRRPYIYLGVDAGTHGQAPREAEAAIAANHRVHLTAEGLIALAHECPGLVRDHDLMCFGTHFGLGEPAVLRLDQEPLMPDKHPTLTFVSQESGYVQTHWHRHLQPSAQRRIVL